MKKTTAFVQSNHYLKQEQDKIDAQRKREKDLADKKAREEAEKRAREEEAILLAEERKKQDKIDAQRKREKDLANKKAKEEAERRNTIITYIIVAIAIIVVLFFLNNSFFKNSNNNSKKIENKVSSNNIKTNEKKIIPTPSTYQSINPIVHEKKTGTNNNIRTPIPAITNINSKDINYKVVLGPIYTFEEMTRLEKKLRQFNYNVITIENIDANYIQVGSFKERNNAYKLSKDLVSLGFEKININHVEK